MEKDIRFTQKKVDDSWKDQIAKEKGEEKSQSRRPQPAQPAQEPQTSQNPGFFNFLTSLGYQAMIHLGETPHPETRRSEVNLDAAKEIIDLLNELEKKTRGNLNAQETDFFQTLLPQLQIKFAQKA